jgi:hypothetical protein
MAFLPQDTQDVSGLPANDAMAQLELQRRLKLAEQLQQSQTPEGKMIGGHYVAPSFTQQLAGVFNKYVGSKQEENAMKQYGDYTQSKEAAKNQAYAKYLKKLEGVDETTMQPKEVPLQQGMNVGTSPFGTTDQVSQIAPKFGINAPAPQNMQGVATQMQPVTTKQPLDISGQYRAMMELGTDLKDPAMIREAMMGNVNRLAKTEDRAADQEFQRILNKDKQGFELSQQERQFAQQYKLQDSSQQFQAGQGRLNRENQYRLQAPIQVIGADGKPQYVERDKAIGMQPYSAAQEAKDVEKIKSQKQAEISAQQVLDSAQALFMHPGRQAATGLSSFRSLIPASEAKDFKANLDTFTAQTFVPMVQALKGMGALSDAEGKKLIDSVGTFDRSVSEEAFAKNLATATRTLYDKARVAGLNVQRPQFLDVLNNNAGSTAQPSLDDDLISKYLPKPSTP